MFFNFQKYKNIIEKQHKEMGKLEKEVEILKEERRDLLEKMELLVKKKSKSGQNAKEEARLQYFFWKVRKVESQLKSLVYQKNYLLSLLCGYQNTETKALTLLQSVASKSTALANGTSLESVFAKPKRISPLSRFR